MKGYNAKNGMVYNTCEKCGTLNFFDETTHQIFSNAKCYHCNSLVEVPNAEDLVEEVIFHKLQQETHPSLRRMYEQSNKELAKLEADLETH